MKYFSILKFTLNYVLAILGKLSGYIITPLVFPFRNYINHYVFNFIKNNNMKLNRFVIVSEDFEKYYLPKGYITKRETNKFLGYILMFFWFYIDNDANLTCCSQAFTDSKDVKGLTYIGSYFELGDLQRENTTPIWTNWTNFKNFYYWMVVRNGFYNYNYLVEDSVMNECGNFNHLDRDPRIHENYKPLQNFDVHHFFQDSNGKWFFRTAMCRIIKGKAYGYEIGWYRTSSGGVNAKIRVQWAKVFENNQPVV